MGCCISTNKASEENPGLQKRRHSTESSPVPPQPETLYSKAPPFPLEEETVKEVLSETPTPKPSSYPKIGKENTLQLPSFPKVEEEKIFEEKNEKKSLVNAVEEVSEMSEICSYSESVSTTTFTTDRKDDEERSRDDGDVRQGVDRSPAKVPRKRFVSGEFAGGTERGAKSPARRFQPSPGRRNDNAVKPAQGREMGQTTRRRISGSSGLWRDPGEGSGRRSRSPATRTDSGGYRSALGQSPSSRRTLRSPGRIPASSPEKGQKQESNGENWPTKESLDNPLVSLECFIFL